MAETTAEELLNLMETQPPITQGVSPENLLQLMEGGQPNVQPGINPTQPSVASQNPMSRAMSQAQNLPPVMTPASKTSPASQFAQELGMSATGEMAGRAIGGMTGPFAPVASPVFGAIGGTAGMIASRLANDQEVTAGDIALEFGTSLIPGFLSEPLVSGGRRLLALSRRGKQVSKNLGAQRILDRFSDNNPLIQQADRMFETVRNAGTQIAPSSFTAGLRGISDRQFKTIKSALLKVSSGSKNTYPQIGEAAEKAFERIRNGLPAAGMDISALSHIRSELTNRAIKMKKGADKDAINSFIDLLDDGIDNGRILRGGGIVQDNRTSREILQQARTAWSMVKDVQDTRKALSTVVKENADGEFIINFGSIKRMLSEPGSKAEESVSAILQRRPIFQVELDSFVKLMDKVKVKAGGFDRLELVQAIAGLFADSAATERFYRIALRKRGVMSAEDITSIALNTLGRATGAGRNASPEQRGAFPFQ